MADWRRRAIVEDLKTGPKASRSTILTEAKEAAVVAFQPHMSLGWMTPDEYAAAAAVKAAE